MKAVDVKQMKVSAYRTGNHSNRTLRRGVTREGFNSMGEVDIVRYLQARLRANRRFEQLISKRDAKLDSFCYVRLETFTYNV